MQLHRTLATLLLLAPLGPAQTGSDSCASPDPLLGQGVFAFDSSAATSGVEGQSEAACYLLGSSTVDHDVWFAWAPGLSGAATVRTCSSSVDTKLAAFPGSTCPAAGTALDCDDDGCGLQSELSFPVQAGSTYLLQVGTFPGAPGGVGSLELAVQPAATNDDCQNPTLLFGAGAAAFDNGGATTGIEGQGESACYLFGSSAVERDVWFRWTPLTTGSARVETCGSAVDTKLAAYPGALCPVSGTALACNDDGCGFQSRIDFPVSAGVPVMIQVGTYPGATGGVGVLSYAVPSAPVEDDCATPSAISGEGAFAFDTSFATTGTEGQAETLCYAFGQSGISNDVWFTWTASASGVARLSTCGSGLDTKLAVYPGAGCPSDGSALACNDDATSCAGVQAEVEVMVVAGSTYTVQLGSFPGTSGGAGTLTVGITPPSSPGLPYCGCDGGNAPCSNGGAPLRGCANGTEPSGARLMGSGVALVGADTLVLSAEGLPPSQPGLYFQGRNEIQAGSGNPFGDGLRCVGGDVRRLGVVTSDGSGTSSTTNFSQPISSLGGVLVGDLRRYQVWYRDPLGSPCGALFNLSNGLSVQW